MSGQNNNHTMMLALAAAEEGTWLLSPSLSSSNKNKPEDKAGGYVTEGSSIRATIFNFANSIIGAGSISLGSAIAQSGGVVSIATISLFAIMSKHSFDLVIGLSREAASAAKAGGGGGTASYESLGYHAFGIRGRVAVMVCKWVYSYGSLVAYLKILKDNFASAVVQLCSKATWVGLNPDIVTTLVGLAVVFPLCLLRNMSGLERCSIAKVAIVFSMLFTMNFLLASSDYAQDMEITTYEKWYEIRPGFPKSLGSLVVVFCAQHTVNLTYQSLKPELQTMAHWEFVSSISVSLSAIISMAIGLTVYATFWTDTSSDMFSLYPAPSIPVAVSKLLLSVMMMFTYPVAFLTCRELCVPTQPPSQLKKPWWLLEPHSTQLILPLHVPLTFLIWASTTFLAIRASSLLDVLNLVGSATGTMIAFVLPALFSYQMRGYTHLAAILLVVGGSIGISGTYFSLVKLLGVEDAR